MKKYIGYTVYSVFITDSEKCLFGAYFVNGFY